MFRDCLNCHSARHIPRPTGVPAFPADKVAATLPNDTVLTASTVRVCDLGATISPPRIVVSVVSSRRRGSGLTLNEFAWGSESPNNGAKSHEGGLERNHGVKTYGTQKAS